MDQKENKNIPIDIFESIQIDFKPEKVKKKRKVDDYDYNDPFLESFEGEFDVVELECKLENFFIYKGKITEDPKRIARKYNNSLKKQKLIDVIQNTDQKGSEGISDTLKFDFEKRLEKLIHQGYKYKKDTKFDNAFIWLVLNKPTTTKFQKYLRFKIISAFKKEGYESLECKNDYNNDTFDDDLQNLHKEIESCSINIMKTVTNEINFSGEMKTFEKFKDVHCIEEMIDFIVQYVSYYACKSDKNIKHIKGLAFEFLIAMFPEKCSNRFKAKHYIFKYVCSKIEKAGYDLEKALNGEFILKEKEDELENKKLKSPVKVVKTSPPLVFDKSKSQMFNSKARIKKPLIDYSNAISSTGSFNPSFNENSVSIGSDLNPSSNSNSLFSKNLSISDQGKAKTGNKSKKIKEMKKQSLSPSTFSVFSSNFLNTEKYKADNQQKSKTSVVLEPSLNKTIPYGDITDGSNELKGFSEYFTPLKSVEDPHIDVQKDKSTDVKQTESGGKLSSINFNSTVVDDSNSVQNNHLTFNSN